MSKRDVIEFRCDICGKKLYGFRLPDGWISMGLNINPASEYSSTKGMQQRLAHILHRDMDFCSLGCYLKHQADQLDELEELLALRANGGPIPEWGRDEVHF